MKVLVTGGAGFIGTALIERLSEHADVIALDCLDRQVHPSGEFPADLISRAECIRAALDAPATYAKQIAAVDVVVHLAAQTGTAQSMYELSRYTSANIGGTAALLEALAERNVRPKRIVLASSRAVYGNGVYRSCNGLRSATRDTRQLRNGEWNPIDAEGTEVATLPMRYGQPTEPTSVYGLTKLWQEQLLRNVCETRRIEYAILRFQNVFGTGQAIGNPYTGVIGYLTQRISAGDEVELFEDGQMTRDFISIDDVARVLECAIFHPSPLNATLDVGSGKAVSLHALALMIGETLEASPRICVSGRFRAGDIRHAVADISDLEATLGIVPRTPLRAALQKYCAWFNAQPCNSIVRHQCALLELGNRGLLHSSDDRPRTSKSA